MEEDLTLTVDGREIPASDGQTILEAALAAGIDIPHLCYDPRVASTGQCRLCLVRIEGRPGLETACTERVRPGMEVVTEDKEIREVRKTILELLLSEHRLSCQTCDMDGECLLQTYAYRYGADERAFGIRDFDRDRPNYTARGEAIRYDPSLCVRCERCVRVCQEVQGLDILTLKGRGFAAEVSTAFDLPLRETPCDVCGNCVGTCPTGALYERPSVGMGQLKDLDRVVTTCPYCGVGCQLTLYVNRNLNRVVRVGSDAGCVPNDGALCVKGRFGLDFVHSPDRLTAPLIRRNGQFEEASWDEALDLVAERLTAIRDSHGPDALAGLSSAKCTNEENYLFQKLVRAALGTNNVDHCARLCHASTVAGLARAFGSGAMTNSIDDVPLADAVFVIGSNTTECHPVLGAMIRQAARTGRTRLIVADPRKIELARHAEVHLQQASGSDVALVNAMMKVIVEEGLWDRAFVEERCEDFEPFLDEVLATDLAEAAEVTGVPTDRIRQAARVYARAERASIVYSMGITQHTTGTDNVLSLANLAMLTGNVGRKSTGVNPLRGQNNVQGACDLGALPDVYSGYQKVNDPGARAKFEEAWGVPLPAEPGLTVVEIINAAADGDVRGLYIMGENPMLSDPDIGHVREALGKLDFLCVQDIFLSETAELADVVLPATCFAEKDGTFTNTERRIQRVRKAVEPPGQARPDWEILCDLSRRMGYDMACGGVAEVMDEIASVTPIYGGVRYDRLEGVGLQWPCTDADHAGTRFLHAGSFTRGRGRFHAVPYKPPAETPDEEYPVVLTTGRRQQHWHTGTMTRRAHVLDWLVPHGEAEISPVLADEYGIEDGEMIRVISRRGSVEVKAHVLDRPRTDSVFMAFHFKEAPANVLTNPALDPIAKIPEFKVCAVRLERIGKDSLQEA